MLRGSGGVLHIALRRAVSLHIALRRAASLRVVLRRAVSLRVVLRRVVSLRIALRCRGVSPHAALQCFGATLRIALWKSLRTTLQYYEASPANLCLHTSLRHGKSLRALRCHGANVLNLWQAMLSYLAANLRLPMAEFATQVMQRWNLVLASLGMLSRPRAWRTTTCLRACLPWRIQGLAVPVHCSQTSLPLCHLALAQTDWVTLELPMRGWPRDS